MTAHDDHGTKRPTAPDDPGAAGAAALPGPPPAPGKGRGRGRAPRLPAVALRRLRPRGVHPAMHVVHLYPDLPDASSGDAA
jgi:hypothetical protein